MSATAVVAAMFVYMARNYRNQIRSSSRAPRRQCHSVACLLLLLALLLPLSACHLLRPTPVAAFRPVAPSDTQHVDLCSGNCRDSVDIVALGVSGFLMVPWRDTTQLVLTPPAYSNPGALRVGLWDIVRGVRSNTARVWDAVRRIPAADSARWARVRAVLVGHGHYDHLMDLPTLAPWLPNATVYGSASVVNTLHPVRQALRADSARSEIRVGPHVTARAIVWDHAPNLWDFGLRYTIAPGHEREPRVTLPGSARGWRMGNVLAWSVDVHDAQGAVAIRVFLHDAAATGEVVREAVRVLGRLPKARRTLSLVVPANYDNAAGYPDVLLATLQPDHVLLAHWEDFFRRPTQPLRIVRAIRGPQFLEHLTPYVGARWTALAPGAVLRIRTD